MPFYFDPGLGGHCIPSPRSISLGMAREYGQHTRFIELAGEGNPACQNVAVNRVAEALNAWKKPPRFDGLSSRLLVNVRSFALR